MDKLIAYEQLLNLAPLNVKPFLTPTTLRWNCTVITAACFGDVFIDCCRRISVVNEMTNANTDTDDDLVKNAFVDEVNQRFAAVGCDLVVNSSDVNEIWFNNLRAIGLDGGGSFTVDAYAALTSIAGVGVDALLSPNIDIYLGVNAAAAIELQTSVVVVNDDGEDINYCSNVAQRCGYVVREVRPLLDGSALNIILESGGSLVGKPLMVNEMPISSVKRLTEVINYNDNVLHARRR